MQKSIREKSCSATLFLEKTYMILDNPEYKNIISWDEDGTLFRITDLDTFATTVLPRHFKHKKIQSFVRQLNIYGFRKVKKQISPNSFKHPHFLRADPSLMKMIKRRVKSRKGQQIQFSSEVEEENPETKNRVKNEKYQALLPTSVECQIEVAKDGGAKEQVFSHFEEDNMDYFLPQQSLSQHPVFEWDSIAFF